MLLKEFLTKYNINDVETLYNCYIDKYNILRYNDDDLSEKEINDSKGFFYFFDDEENLINFIDYFSDESIFDQDLLNFLLSEIYLSLGNFYYGMGRGYIRKDIEKARNSYMISSRMGNNQATCNLGYLYLNGEGVEIDYEKAYKYFSDSAISGNPNAVYKLGDFYKEGIYVKKSEEEAFRKYMMASEMLDKENPNYDISQDIYYKLGLCYKYGFGVENNILQALNYFLKALSFAYFSLISGNSYSKGRKRNEINYR